ncbi:SusC/RagA family TonB-linked outer membrane protein [Moheibacter sediminis]|uniref:TonB-linked outer membrane protein, SusC/RagA family n=1 Tax=Moheibacter sediminis TaxID=1434700 RepID=A0A1W2BDS0_9FLAO|nr:SusC/RagA family TonB-linked outer membrane protein [Moheibacter sediminis]SMC70951.1 TonB-linked outer membrane protein, SusC/RagA family [Moheibacter sediminis]
MRTKFAFLSALFLLLVGQVVFAQVTGIVQDGDGFPLSDAEVTVRGGDASAITNEKGAFSIDAKVGDVLVVADLFGTTKEFNVSKNNLGVLKLGEALVLTEVTLVGGVKLDAAQRIGANTVVGRQDFELAPVSSVDEVLNGRVAGLSFSTNSGHPGGTNLITIRGVGSFVGTPNPLYVIDGVVVGKGQDAASIMESFNPLSSIDPNSIENIAVLKDASATALYGARGANGVIVVTTKRGKYNQKTRFNLSSDFGIQNIAFDDQKWMTSEEFIKWGGLTLFNANPGNFESMQAAVDQFSSDRGWDGTTNTDWLDAVTRNNASVKTYNFSATGGSENTSFRIGGAYTENRPLLVNSKFDRFSSNLAVDHKVSDKFKLGGNVNFTHISTTGIDDGGAFRNPFLTVWTIAPIYPVYNESGDYNQDLGAQSDYNPVGLQNVDEMSANIKTFVSSINAEFQFAKNFYAYSMFGTQYQIIDELQFWSKQMGDGLNYGGNVVKSNTQTFDWNWNNSISYRNVINEKHDVQAFVGVEYQEHKYFNLGAQAWQLVRDIPWITFGSQDQDQILPGFDDFLEWKQYSYFARGNYIYDSKYTLSATVRNDNNSTLGNDKSGWFWSVGAGWDVAKEKFMPSFLGELTLRASYGEIGNVPYADGWGSIYNQYTLVGAAGYGGQPSLDLIRIGDPTLIWETAEQLNLGLDFRLASNVFGASVDVYNKTTSSAIYNASIANTTYPGTSQRNIGEIINKGVEVAFDARPINKEFKWILNGNFSYNKGTVGNMLNPDEIQVSSLRGIQEGRLFAEYYMRGWAGVDPLTGAGLYFTDETETETTTDRASASPYFQGTTPFPMYMAGLKTEFIYKGFSLSAFFTGQFEFSVMNRWQNYVTNDGEYNTYNQTTDVLYDSWTPENPNASNPIQIAGNSSQSNLFSTRHLRDGDHIRLKEAKVAYSFGELFKRSTGVDNLTVYVKGTNLWLWVFDEDLNFDPESNTNAFGGGWQGKGQFDYTAPIMRTISLGVSIDF